MKTKKELRQTILRQLKNLPEDKRVQYTKTIHEKILNSSQWQTSQVIGLTISQGIEWDTHHLIQTAWKQNKKVVVPKVNPEKKRMDFYMIESFDQLEKVFYDLWEPKVGETQLVTYDDIELLVVPGLVFNSRGYRIGFGGGYYDRMLTQYKGVTLSQLCSQQWNEDWEVESFDQPIDILVSENEWIEINK